MKLDIFCDGGARGNPGPAAVGVVIKWKMEKGIWKMEKFGKKIGRATNNVAEYKAVIEALKWLIKNKNIIGKPLTINIFLDSRLVINQLNGFFKIKNSNIRELILAIRGLEQEVGGKIFYSFIPREKNRLADTLVNQSLNKA